MSHWSLPLRSWDESNRFPFRMLQQNAYGTSYVKAEDFRCWNRYLTELSLKGLCHRRHVMKTVAQILRSLFNVIISLNLPHTKLSLVCLIYFNLFRCFSPSLSCHDEICFDLQKLWRDSRCHSPFTVTTCILEFYWCHKPFPKHH